ncbi:hypothetical protein MJO28_001181 [Puccinia striiformis f. sp. tritici]|uniref:Uncharacterized protein n=1 Tax=Puccinia striiformis f. sp. tritici TaxID=168172 RepID=A0ACC0F0A8_9BASI|nr:hypothetical protein MJO28_001181 [Puccinia striiformis f. sp. tritici]
MLRRSYSRPDLAYSRPGIVERTGGSYDLGGRWRPDNYGSYTVHFNNHAYDRSLHACYYNLEDDYYGSYGDLLEYEAALRLNRHLSEQERLQRWRMRLAFEELEEAERMRRYRSMAHTDRMLLGLSDHSWWGERYGSHPFHHRPDWRSRFGDKIRRWDSTYLPLSSSLSNRYAPVWGDSRDLTRNDHHHHHHLHSDLSYPQSNLSRVDNRLLDSERRINQDLRYHELDNVERRLENQEDYLIQENMIHDQERAIENQMMDNVLYERERSDYNNSIREQEIMYDQDRRLDRLEGTSEIMYEQERRIEEDVDLYRDNERRLEDIDRGYLGDTIDQDILRPEYDSYPVDMDIGLEDNLARNHIQDDFIHRERLDEDLLY